MMRNVDIDRNAKLPREGRPAASARWAAGGMIGALLASACCVGPLALAALGVSGAWIGAIAHLEPFQPVFAALALACIAFGLRSARRSAAACAADGACAQPQVERATLVVLWVAAVLVLGALSMGLWAPLLA